MFLIKNSKSKNYFILGTVLTSCGLLSYSSPIIGTANASTNTYLNTYNWAGYEMSDGYSSHLNAISINYTEPKLSWNSNNFTDSGKRANTENLVLWAGLGDGVGGDILQAGTASSLVKDAKGRLTETHSFFFEDYGKQDLNKVDSNQIKVRPGDKVSISLLYDQSTRMMSYGFCNNTLNTCFAVVDPEIHALPRNHVEVIAEKPEVNNVLYALPNFGKVTFSNVSWYRNNNINMYGNVHGINYWQKRVLMNYGRGVSLSSVMYNTRKQQSFDVAFKP